MNEKHERKGNYGSKRFFTVDRIIFHLNYYPWTKSQTIKRKIASALEISETEGLKPFDIENVHNELKEQKKNGAFLPNMELIWNELEKKY